VVDTIRRSIGYKGGVASAAEKQLLVAPDAVARAAAPMAQLPEQRWMLRQPRDIRRSFCEEVFGRPDEEQRQQIWMLHQSRELRESFIEHVLLKDDEPSREEIWMLRQDDEICRDYARFVLMGEGEPGG
jgi:hypothetical protein